MSRVINIPTVDEILKEYPPNTIKSDDLEKLKEMQKGVQKGGQISTDRMMLENILARTRLRPYHKEILRIILTNPEVLTIFYLGLLLDKLEAKQREKAMRMQQLQATSPAPPGGIVMTPTPILTPTPGLTPTPTPGLTPTPTPTPTPTLRPNWKNLPTLRNLIDAEDTDPGKTMKTQLSDDADTLVNDLTTGAITIIDAVNFVKGYRPIEKKFTIKYIWHKNKQRSIDIFNALAGDATVNIRDYDVTLADLPLAGGYKSVPISKVYKNDPYYLKYKKYKMKYLNEIKKYRN